jgi:hypothetical protein
MKFVTATLLTAFLGYVICLYLPWWGFALTSFIVAVTIHQLPYRAVIAGFLAIFLFWGVYAIIIDANNGYLLSKKVAQILPFGGSVFLLILITALLGGLLSGFAALAGCYARKVERSYSKRLTNR